jgi:hypothetical protein
MAEDPRLELPAELRHLSNCVTLVERSDGVRVYIVGTCHISDTSAADCAEVIRTVRPATVVLELCEKRGGKLLPGPYGDVQYDNAQFEIKKVSEPEPAVRVGAGSAHCPSHSPPLSDGLLRRGRRSSPWPWETTC